MKTDPGEAGGMDAFLRYVRRFRSDLVFRGSSEAAIAELQACYPRPLPWAYVDYLRVMGEDPAGFNLLGDASTDLPSVLDRTRDLVGDPFYAPLMARCVLIGEQHGVSEDLALEDQGPGEPRVVSVDVSVLYTVARTLRHLLMGQAFVVAMRAYPHRRHWSGRIQATRAEIEAEAARLGFEELWFSEEQAWYGERPHARLRMSCFDDGPLGVSLATDEPEWMATLDDLCRHRWAFRYTSDWSG